MLSSYIPILIIMALAVVCAWVFVSASKFFGPKNPNQVKLSTYESGMEPVGTARTRFSVKYYMAAMLFIIFDIEIVFLYPWAVAFREFRGSYLTYALVEMIVFIVILIIGYIYMLRKGALKWD
jgi:NADH-quinone oxidoreductase subunit A